MATLLVMFLSEALYGMSPFLVVVDSLLLKASILRFFADSWPR